jgi:hypothetical protein
MEIQGIVDALNAAPFHKHLSLVSFDEQSAFDLLHTVINVLGHINSDYAAETAHADQQTVAMRITEALKVNRNIFFFLLFYTCYTLFYLFSFFHLKLNKLRGKNRY